MERGEQIVGDGSEHCRFGRSADRLRCVHLGCRVVPSLVIAEQPVQGFVLMEDGLGAEVPGQVGMQLLHVESRTWRVGHLERCIEPVEAQPHVG